MRKGMAEADSANEDKARIPEAGCASGGKRGIAQKRFKLQIKPQIIMTDNFFSRSPACPAKNSQKYQNFVIHYHLKSCFFLFCVLIFFIFGWKKLFDLWRFIHYDLATFQRFNNRDAELSGCGRESLCILTFSACKSFSTVLWQGKLEKRRSRSSSDKREVENYIQDMRRVYYTLEKCE